MRRAMATTLTWLRTPVGKASTMRTHKKHSCIHVCAYRLLSARQQVSSTPSRGRTLRKTSLLGLHRRK